MRQLLRQVWKRIWLMPLMLNLTRPVLARNLTARQALYFLLNQGTDLIVIEDIEIEGEGIASEAGFYNMAVMSLDENGAEIGKERVLTDEDQLLGRGIANVLSSIDHLALQQAKLGAQMSKAEIQLDVLQSRKLAVTRDISAMGDADLAKLVTELQSQLTNRDAAQQAFAKIGQQSLFDYIR